MDAVQAIRSEKQKKITELMIEAEEARKRGDDFAACGLIDRVYELADAIAHTRKYSPSSGQQAFPDQQGEQ